MTTVGSDADARRAIRERLSSNLYVEAGAGTGKTTSLVSRVATIITNGRATIEQIVAITFTRAAASELRSRIRRALEEFIDLESEQGESVERATNALGGIDNAAFQTIDSFALALLRERPLEAGLPPVVTPRDELQAEIEFAEVWRNWLDSELSADDGKFREAVGRAMRLGLNNPIVALHEVAVEFHRNYDLLESEEFVPPTATQRETFESLSVEFGRIGLLLSSCNDESDRLFVHVQEIVKPWVERANAEISYTERDYLLAECPRLTPGNAKGRKENWLPTSGGTDSRAEIIALLESMQSTINSERQVAAETALSDMLACIKRMVLDYAARRREAGTLEFHDMLVLARELLATDLPSREHFRRRYPVVLVDEFQDTDPVQNELLTLLTQSDHEGHEGSLFRVGDPKQSIYRFRRAEVTISDEVRSAAESRGDWVRLQENHRSQRPIIDWVNHVFGDWMDRQIESLGKLQTRYIPLIPATASLVDVSPSAWPSAVRWFGSAREDDARHIRDAEFQDLAGIAAAAGAGTFTVRDVQTGRSRPSIYGDLCVLLRTRTGIDQLEQAFSDANIPFTLEGQSLLFGTQEFRDIENALTAIDDPTDQVAVAAVLRSPVFGCDDAELWLWANEGGSFDYSRPQGSPAALASPAVAAAFESLQELHRLRMTHAFPVVVERLIRDRRLLESSHLAPYSAERVRRIELFLEHSRELRDTGVTSLREFLSWVRHRREGRARAPETVTSESGARAVRVMTIHAAKGLEFPIVVLAGISSSGGRSSNRVIVNSQARRGGRVHVRLGRQELQIETSGYRNASDYERAAEEAETSRILYVAATRARDHLFVSLYRRATRMDSTPASEFEAICAGHKAIWQEYVPTAGVVARQTPEAATAIDLSIQKRAQWIESRSGSLVRASRRGYVTATELHAGSSPPVPKERSSDAQDEPWRRGRASLAMGRAVHGVLQVAALDGSDIQQLAEEQAVAHDLPPDTSRDIADMVRMTLESPSVAAARGKANCWRELWVAAPVEFGETNAVGRRFTIEGAIDLIYESDDGTLVVVDYKTDRVDGRTLEEKAAPYILQLGAYAWAVHELTKIPVSRAVLVFSAEAAQGRPAEFEVPNLENAMSQALEAALPFFAPTR